jgi:hypothetical protein
VSWLLFAVLASAPVRLDADCARRIEELPNSQSQAELRSLVRACFPEIRAAGCKVALSRLSAAPPGEQFDVLLSGCRAAYCAPGDALSPEVCRLKRAPVANAAEHLEQFFALMLRAELGESADEERRSAIVRRRLLAFHQLPTSVPRLRLEQRDGKLLATLFAAGGKKLREWEPCALDIPEARVKELVAALASEAPTPRPPVLRLERIVDVQAPPELPFATVKQLMGPIEAAGLTINFSLSSP